MITINVWGNCMTRDILNPLVSKGKLRVLQYVGVGTSHPISAFSDKGRFEVKIDDLKDYRGSNFEKRCFCQDINKTALDYLIERKADYLLIDLMSIRLNMLKKQKHYIVCGYPYVLNKEKVFEDYRLDNYEMVTPYDINIDTWYEYIDKFCNFILKYYSLNQIIFHECYGTAKYIDDKPPLYKTFSTKRVEEVNQYNQLAKKVNTYFEEKMEGCHVIKFCENVMSDKANPLGLHPLHYEKSYYEYGAEAVKIICQNFFDDEEAVVLEELRKNYTDKFSQLNENLNLKNELYWTKNALNFCKNMIFDQFGGEKFKLWLTTKKEQNAKISVLVSQNVAGQILTVALKKFEIPTLFISSKITFDDLTDEEFELCRQSDVVVCADVHRIIPPKKEEVCAVLISELLE
ncbi:MAG: hypothetical protein HDR12_03810 [Lachnospiraceae bacterium]|nr:hypothetical protein [Lachnospiraceae bacterium]